MTLACLPPAIGTAEGVLAEAGSASVPSLLMKAAVTYSVVSFATM